MDKEIVLNKIKEKLSEDIYNFVNFIRFDDKYSCEVIKKEIEVTIRENLPKEPPFKNVTTKINKKGDGVIIEFELNPSYKHLLEEV